MAAVLREKLDVLVDRAVGHRTGIRTAARVRCSRRTNEAWKSLVAVEGRVQPVRQPAEGEVWWKPMNDSSFARVIGDSQQSIRWSE